MFRLGLYRVANEALLRVMNSLQGIGFDVSTKSKFMPVAMFMMDKTGLDIVQGLTDEQYEQVFDQMMGPQYREQDVLLENTGYNPDEWSQPEPQAPAKPVEDKPKESNFVAH